MSEISSVRVESLGLPLKESFEIILRTQYNASNVVVFVGTETGVVGLGGSSPDHYVTGETQGTTLDTVSEASKLFVGHGVADYRAIIEDLYATFPSAVSSLFALETAIIGAYYREIDIPVVELFDRGPDIVKTDMTIPIHTPNIVAKKAESAVQNSFETLKTEVDENLGTDIRRVRSVSKVAPNAMIIVDADRGWSVSETVMLDQAMHDARISLSLLEQPVVKSDIAGLASIRNGTRAPVGASEAVFTPRDTVCVIRNDAADIINIKFGKFGLLGAADIAAITWATGRGLMMGCMLESSVGVHTSAHLVSGIGGFSHVDLDATRLLDGDITDREPGPTITPSGPGHGITPSWWLLSLKPL